MKKKFIQRGVILGESSPTTYLGGSIPYEIRNPSGDWEPFIPPGEWQRSDAGDSMSCVSFASLNEIETQKKLLTGNQVNYSDRWIAKMSGTTRQGNRLDKVAETIREYGLVLESSYPSPVSYTWDEYHAEIPELLMSKLLAEGQEWLKKWEIKYEVSGVNKESLQKELKHAPIQVVIPGHDIVCILSDKDIDRIYDQYEPFIKNIPGYYPGPIIYAFKIILYKKEQALDPDMLLADIKYGDSGNTVLRLKRALARLGFMTKTGNLYDNNLKNAVFSYQLSNIWTTNEERRTWEYYWVKFWYKGSLVEAKTRESINNNLKFRK